MESNVVSIGEFLAKKKEADRVKLIRAKTDEENTELMEKWKRTDASIKRIQEFVKQLKEGTVK